MHTNLQESPRVSARVWVHTAGRLVQEHHATARDERDAHAELSLLSCVNRTTCARDDMHNSER